jgi:septal ring factor EnvC (AmiA/AmiB activator)
MNVQAQVEAAIEKPSFMDKLKSVFVDAQAFAKAQTDLAAALQTISALQTEKTNLQAQLTAAQTQVTSLTTQIAAKDSEITTLNATIADPNGEIEKRATAKATAALKGIGITPIKESNAAEAAASTDGEALIVKLEAITDSQERVIFYRQNKAAIDAAWSKRK